MKVAHIAPPAYVGVTTESGYRFLLGQHLMTDEKYFQQLRYSNWYASPFVMIDNGEAEGEQVTSFKDLVLKTFNYADEWVLPDVFRQAEPSYDKTIAGSKWVLPRARAICPQGDTLTEWQECFEAIDTRLEGKYATICVPKHAERWGSRSQIVKYLVDNRYHEEHHIHLLGIWTDPIREIQALGEWRKFIRGIDTGAALAWAQWGARVDGTPEGERYSLDWNDTVEEHVTRDLAYKNCNLIQEAANA